LVWHLRILPLYQDIPKAVSMELDVTSVFYQNRVLPIDITKEVVKYALKIVCWVHAHLMQMS
jgi:hypothetical protein